MVRILWCLVFLGCVAGCLCYSVNFTEEELRKHVALGLHDLRCTEKYGKKMARLEGDDDLTYIPFSCKSEECKQCLKPREAFNGSLFSLDKCLEYCHQNFSVACDKGCDIMNDIKSQDNKSIPMDNSTDVIVNKVSLTCRTALYLMVQTIARYTSHGVPTDSPYGFILFHRDDLSKKWKIVNQPYDIKDVTQVFSEEKMQFAVAMVSTRGLVAKTTSYSSLLDGILTNSEMLYSLYKQEWIIQPIKHYSLKYILTPNPDRVATVSCALSWDPPSPSKPCVYALVTKGDEAHIEKKISFVNQYNDNHLYYRPVFSYTFTDLALDKPYILEVLSLARFEFSSFKKEKNIAIRTPSLIDIKGVSKNATNNTSAVFIITPGPPRNVTLSSFVYLGNDTSLATVTWQPPIMTSFHAEITEYIFWCKITEGQKWKKLYQLRKWQTINVHLDPVNTSYIFEVHTGMEYTVTVSANSTFGEGEETFLNLTVPYRSTNQTADPIVTRIVTKTKSEVNKMHLIAIGVLLALILPMVATGRYLYKKRRAREAKAMRIQLRDEFLEEGLILPIGEPDEWEVEYDMIVLGEEIGSGAFGTVCKANASTLPGYPDQRDIVVAVKTLKAMATIDDRKDFLAEIAMMKQIGKHLNVVSMLGCVTQGGPLCLITEYCCHGDLRSYLRLIRDKTKKHPHFKLGPAYHMHVQKLTPKKNSYGQPSKQNGLFKDISHSTRNEGFRHSPSFLDNTPPARGNNMRNCLCLGACTCSSNTYVESSNVGEDYCNELQNRDSFTSDISIIQSKNPFKINPPPSLAQPLTPIKVKPQAHKSTPDEATSKDLRGHECRSGEGRDSIEHHSPYVIPLKVIGRRHSEELIDIMSGPDEPLVKFTNQEYNDSERATTSCNGGQHYANDDQDDDGDRKELSQNVLMSFARQVAVGMEYLSQKKFVHRDLAARNILVCDNNLVKVSDFGLTRDVCTSIEYHKSSNMAKLPLKWMAPESIFENVNSSKSDVWSYGILLWEIVTLGGSPYPGISGKDLCKMLKDGYRMGKPDMCSQQIYNIMKSCWEFDPQRRPTFTELRNQLESLMEIEDEVYIDVNFDGDEYSMLVRYSSSESSSS